MNGIASLANKLEHGTKDGNKLYQSWQKKEAGRKQIVAEIEAAVKEKRSCEAKYCYGRKPFEKRKISTACKACAVPLQRLNQAEKEYNEMVDKINSLYKKYQDFLVAGGDPASKKGSELSHAPIKLFDEFNKISKRMYRLERELWKCDPHRCNTAVEDDKKIKIGEDIESEPGEKDTGEDSTGTNRDQAEKKFAVGAGCTGLGCPSENIPGSCTGDTCPDLFLLTCNESQCPETFTLDCATTPCPPDVILDCDALGCYGENIEFVFDPVQETGPATPGTAGGEVDSTAGAPAGSLQDISTRCTPCQPFATEYNRRVDDLLMILEELDEALQEKASLEERISNLELFDLALQYPTENGLVEWWLDGKKYMSYVAIGGGSRASFHGPDALSNMKSRRQQIRTLIDLVTSALREINTRVSRLQAERDAVAGVLANISSQLRQCERQCATVEILDVKNLLGNNPYNQRDPVRDEGGDSQTAGGNISVIFCTGCGPGVFVPVAGLIIAGPDACPANHYHGGPAKACDGSTYADPAPGVCGYGEVSDTTSIPVSQCNN
ncbi:MAG: hypothetical protein MI673_03375 [Thiotrichales bacterium]|nr:hypothetical protein [Thiotrichales bacterium]